jgi:DNA-binding MarR family transcriptional regulator
VDHQNHFRSGLDLLKSARLNVEAKKQLYERLAAFRYVLRRFLRFSEEVAAEFGMTAQHYLTLLAVEGYPAREEITIKELAERLQLEHHSVVGLVNRLSRDGLLLRKDSPQDKRCVLVRLTAKGKKVLEKLALRHQEHMDQHCPEFLRALGEVCGISRKP